MFEQNYWDILQQYKKDTETIFPEYIQTIETSLSYSWLLQGRIMKLLSNTGELPPYKQFINVYYLRNIHYLTSAFNSAIINQCSSSRDLQRTIFETIVRGYLMIVDNSVANKMYIFIVANNKDKTIRRKDNSMLKKIMPTLIDPYFSFVDNFINKNRINNNLYNLIKEDIEKYWLFKNNASLIYDKRLEKGYNKLYEHLSPFSHPSITGSWRDVSYSKTEIEDCLKTISMLIYSNLQMFIESFDVIDDEPAKRITYDTFYTIANTLEYIPNIEPNKDKFNLLLKYKDGNVLAKLKY